MSFAELFLGVACFFVGHDWTEWRQKQNLPSPWDSPGGKKLTWNERHCFRCNAVESTRPELA